MAKFLHSINGGVGIVAGGSEQPQVAFIEEDKWPNIQKWYSMTQRELQIARSVCCGLSNRQIAGNLKIRQGTVKTHMRNIYRKTWVNNKIAMLLRFMEAANSASSPSFDAQAQIKQNIQTENPQAKATF